MSPSLLFRWRRGLCAAVLLGLAFLSATSSVRAVGGFGNGVIIGSDIHDANGKIYDYVVMTGPSVTVIPDAGQVARVIFVDPDGDLVFADYSGAGFMNVALDQPTGPAPLAKYKLNGGYMKGRAWITIQGHDATSNLTVAAVGALTSSINSAIFRNDVSYDGVADIGGIQIVAIGASQFGGLRAGNARFSGTANVIGVNASNVSFLGPVLVGDIDAASDINALPSPTNGSPSLRLGAATEVRILGGDLAQSNGANVRVSGFTALTFEATTNAHGVIMPAKSNAGVLENVAVTGQPVFTSAKTASVFEGAALSFVVKASSVAAPTYSIASGKLPAWAALNATSGVISGTPLHTLGSSTFTVLATNGAATASQTITLSVIPSPTTSNLVLAISGDAAPDRNGTLTAPSIFALSEGAAAFTTTTTGTAGGSTDDWILATVTREGYRTVFREGASAPNNGQFSSTLGHIAVNPSGRVSFYGILANTAQGSLDSEGIYSGTDSSVTQIARANQTEPAGGPGVFNSFGTPLINASDQVVFWGAIRNAGTPLISTHGIFVGSGGSLTQIARTYTTTAPGGGTFTSLDSTPSISESGEVAFYGSTTSGNGVFRSNGTTSVAIARVGQAPPEGNGTLGDINAPFLNSNNKVVFYTTLNGSSGGTLDKWGIYSGTGGALTKIVRTGDAAPGGGQFDQLNNSLSINSQGDVAYTATLRNVPLGQNKAVFWGNGTQTKTIARSGDATPEGGSTFTDFVGAAINDSRTVAFQANLSLGADYRGIYLGDGTETMLVARVGDQVLGSTIVGLGFDPRAYNQLKEIAYQVILADGRWGVMIFSPKLKWRQNGDGTWDDGSRWTVSLRPAGYAIAEIDPATGGLVTGPQVATTLRSLKIGGTTTGTAELNLQAEGPVTAVEGATIAAHGKVSGVGVVKGKVTNAGTVSPGNSPGLLKFDGDFTQSASGQSIFQIGGVDPSLIDQLWVTGTADVSGTVKVELLDGYAPTAPVSAMVIRAQSLHLNSPTFQGPAGYTLTTAIKIVDDDQFLQVTLTPLGAPPPLTAVQSIASKTLTAATASFGFVPVTGTDGTPPYTYAISPALPANLVFDTGSGAISGTATAASTATYTITVTDAANATATNTFVLTVNPTVVATLAIANHALTAGVAAATFTPVTAANGASPYTFTVSPALPAGLTLSATTGAISGAPTVAAAAANYTILVTDSLGATSSKAFNLVVNPAFTAGTTITSSSLTAGTAAVAFTPLTVAGGTGPVVYSVSPALPAGLSLDATTGAISGTPTAAAASAAYSITATDSVGATVVRILTLVANAPLVATSAIPSKTMTFNVAVTPFAPVTVTGGTAPFTFAISPALAPGLAMAVATGVISGKPTLAESAVTHTVTITDAAGAIASATTTLTVPPVAPTISVSPQPQAVSQGTGFTLSVVAAGSPLSYQWRRNGVDISGATNSVFNVANAQVSDAGDYTVFVSNTAGDVTSAVATITVLPVGFLATHALVGEGYQAGGTVTITNTFTYSGALSTLGWQVLLPPGWSFASDFGTAGAMGPTAGATDLIEWTWNTPPPSGTTFTYTLNVPDTTIGLQTIAALYLPQPSGTRYAMLVKPDPLAVDESPYYSADTNHDFKISLVELLAVIELYNTRNGTVRTGAYKVNEDVFVPDPARSSTAVVTLPFYHSADTNHDAKFNLVELLRVVELYNYREGTVRTGRYHKRRVVDTITEDGFSSGP